MLVTHEKSRFSIAQQRDRKRGGAVATTAESAVYVSFGIIERWEKSRRARDNNDHQRLHHASSPVHDDFVTKYFIHKNICFFIFSLARGVREFLLFPVAMT